MNSNFTYIDEESIYVCNYCGAYAKTKDEVIHYKTCTRDAGQRQYDDMFEEKNEN